MSSAAAASYKKTSLREIAQETYNEIPKILKLRPDAPDTGYLSLPSRYVPLSSRYFPNLSTRVEVVNGDTFDVAIRLNNTRARFNGHTRPVCVLNLANERVPGGGWLSGAMAQEEALCFRSTLSKTLKRRFYPIPDCGAVYSPTVVIFRENYNNSHQMMDVQRAQSFPVVSVVSVAAICNPALDTMASPPKYKNPEDRELMKEKMRITLRVAVHNRHRSLVLGALGCGVFGNPNQEVAQCWIEVLQEQEFRGWWHHIVFAVLQNKGASPNNFDVFHGKLHGLRV